MLDFFIICDKVRGHLKSMVVDEKNLYSLTNFHPAKQGRKVKISDHNPLIMELNLKSSQRKSERLELFNFKNEECQKTFHSLTNETRRFNDCFDNDLPFKEQAKNWELALNSIFHQSFTKVRITEHKVKETEISSLLEKRKQLKLRINKGNEDLDDELEVLERKIANECEKENRDKVTENLSSFGENQLAVNTNGMWNVKRKIFPKNAQTKPTGKKNARGQIITSPEGLKLLYLETYKHRLRHRPIHQDLKEIKILKETLFYLRLQVAKETSSKPWSMKHLEKVLSSLKTTKARDPKGLVNDLFKPGVIGQNLKKSLLTLLNKIKVECIIPEFMEWANITSLYKGKGDRLDLTNDRGIFLVTVFRGILMKLIYNDKYDILDKNMSDSNVGGRKGKSIRNHIFLINGIIMDVLSSKSKSIDVQILDYKQCFDAMWLEETLNDMYEGGLTDNNLAVLYEANKKVKVAVKTPHGLTDRIEVNKIILQGDVFGPIECSVSVDTYGKECLAEEIHLYSYKEEVQVPPLAMVDDLLIVSKCGYKAVMANAYINTKSNLKKLQFGTDKCHKMHVGRMQEEICPDLFVDGWRLNDVKDVETKAEYGEDEEIGLVKMEEVENEKYLGDIISQDGKNMKNILARTNRGIGIRNQILSILDEICFGRYYFEVAVLLRNSLFLSSILTNSEAWYNLKKEEIDILEQADESLLRKILECPASTPKEMIYLELNCLPIRYIIKCRRVNFLSYIVREDKKSLIYRFLEIQLKKPTKNDWGQTVESDLEELDIATPPLDIAKIPLATFKRMTMEGICRVALNYLNGEKGRHSKVLHISHKHMKIQDYLSPNNIGIHDAKFLFYLRTRMVDVKTNYRGSNSTLQCPLCKNEQDTQEHLLTCSKLDGGNEVVSDVLNYSDLFGDNLERKITLTKVIHSRFKKRKVLLKRKEKQPNGPGDPENLLCGLQ